MAKYYNRKNGMRVYKNGECDLPLGERFNVGDFYVSAQMIDYTYTHSTLVYFVSSNNGDEFGQFATEQQAIDKCIKVAKSAFV